MFDKDERVADLTMDELYALIQQSVQEAVAEVLLELSMVAEYEQEIEAQAELTDWLRSSLGDYLAGHSDPGVPHLDD
jgi:L-aminopeptidase/D-esterase-like protein